MEISFNKLAEPRFQEVWALYNYYIQNTTATFHADPISEPDMRALVFFEGDRYQTYSIMADGSFCGYVLLTRFKNREAYDGTAEVTIYLGQEYAGQGIGTRALRFIEEAAIARGLHVLLATITGENEASIGLFSRNGYTKCAHFKEVGKKFGRWLDVVAYQKIL